jgi:DNA end-binding protein Ku
MGLPSKVPIQFLGVTANLKLVTAVDEDSSGFKMVCDHTKDGKKHAPAPVKMPAICTSCGHEGNRFSFPRGKETENGLVVLSQEELEAAGGPPVKTMVVTAHPLKAVLENTFPGKTYLLVPSDAPSVEVYSAIRQALEDNPDVGLVTTFAVQTRTALWRIGINGDALALTELAWPDTVRARPAIPRVEVVAELRALANEYLALHTVPFDPADYKDTAKVAKEALVAAKAGTAVPLQALPDQVPANVSTSLLDRLKKSVEEAKTRDVPAPAKKAAAKKATAKRTTARKTSAQKTA